MVEGRIGMSKERDKVDGLSSQAMQPDEGILGLLI
jgi:hypothetical protein